MKAGIKVMFKSQFGQPEIGVVTETGTIRVWCDTASYQGYFYYPVESVTVLKVCV